MSAHYPKVLVNQIGYRPNAGKYVVVDGVRGAKTFTVIDMDQRGFQEVMTGPLYPGGSELGEYLIGDFSAVRQPGRYRIAVEGCYPLAAGETTRVWTHDFYVGNHVYDDAIRKSINYYQIQSCGASKRGYNSPCHVGIIPRDDGREAIPVSGGWHSAHDTSRNVHEIIHGCCGLMALAESRPDLKEALDILYEMQWGNHFFLDIQDPDGYIYRSVNGKPGSWMNFMEMDWWATDNLIVYTEPAPVYLQHHFITIQARYYQFFKEKDAEYATKCLEAGERCFEWVSKKGGEWKPERFSYELGTGISAGTSLYLATGDEQYLAYAREMADQLMALQAPEGYFPENCGPAYEPDEAAAPEFVRMRTVYTELAALGLIDAARWLTNDPDRPKWIASLERYVDGYVKHFSEANAFGLLPYRAYKKDMARQTSRSWGSTGYRYFMETDYWIQFLYWQAGDISHRAGHGINMIYLSELLDKPWLKGLAQRQLDWVFGVNPFDASMVIGVGRNQPPSYPSTELQPPVPDIDGATMQGIQGDAEDNPILLPGFYASVEFWMPHHAWLLWLMAELSRQ